jgi:undecaprenyl pyrophosphate phosphatase UppP
MISILVTLVIIGLLLWLVNNYIPMDSKIKSILNIIIVIAVIIWLLQAFGLLGGIGLR